MDRRSPLTAVLRVPLLVKLAGANLIIVGACAMLPAMGVTHPLSGGGFAALTVVFVLSLVVTLGLVLVALRPLKALEETARRVWSGDYDARVPMSPLADSSMRRISTTFNVLLDRLTSDRQRMRELAAAVIRAGDRERAGTARELQESAAQSLAAISWQLSALARDATGTEWQPKVAAIKETTDQVLDEVRFLAQTLYPRVLSDLGLGAALTHLARRAREGSDVEVIAEVDSDAAKHLDTNVSASLYYVAQEAVSNALYHADPTRIVVRLHRAGTSTVLEVEDNGSGFEVAAQERRSGSGLFSMRERVGLIDAHMDVDSAIGRGTKVRVHLGDKPVLIERTA